MIRKFQRVKGKKVDEWAIEIDGRRLRVISNGKISPWTVYADKKSKSGVDKAETLCMLSAINRIQTRIEKGFVDLDKQK